eukprot:GSChrysophyteH1.ASY1.ANO1.2521.1 assembled CDS
MPHLVLCNRYWRISGDELPITAVCAIGGRLVALCIFIALLNLADEDSKSCHDNFTIYVGISVAVFALSILVECGIIYAGLKGTMVEMSLRHRELELALSLHYVFAAVQALLAIWGILLISDSLNLPCTNELLESNSHEVVLLTVVCVMQTVDVTSQFFCCYLLKAGGMRSSRHGALAMEEERRRGQGAEGLTYNGGWDDDVGEDSDGGYEAARATWEKRCNSLCRCSRFCSCGIFGGSDIAQDIEAVANVMTSFFRHDGFLDVVPSDVLAGILLVRLQQRRTVQRFHSEKSIGEIGVDLKGKQANYTNQDNSPDIEDGLIHSQHNPRQLSISLPERSRDAISALRRELDPTSLDDREIIRIALRMAKFSFATYSHLLFLYTKPVTAACKLCASCILGNGCNRNKGFPPRNLRFEMESDSLPEFPRGDNCCALNHAAVASVVDDIGAADTVFASYINDAEVKPYCIFIDHETEAIVVAIRGSLSLEDCVTDVLCEPEEMTAAGKKWNFNGEGKWAHSGMLRSAMKIREDLEKQGVLQELFFGNSMENASTSAYSYQLVVTGHSLGAGNAVLLSLMLQSQYPSLQCYAFGTPGSLVDATTAERCKDWLTTVVLNNDLIARAGKATLNHLREQVLSAITRAKVTKTQIMRTLIEEVDIKDFLYPVGEEPDSEFKDEVDHFLQQMRIKNEDRGKVTELVLPGKIIALSKEGRGLVRESTSAWKTVCKCLSCAFSGFCRNKRYIPEETSREAFSEIVVSPSMAVDHFPDRYVTELENLYKNWMVHAT